MAIVLDRDELEALKKTVGRRLRAARKSTQMSETKAALSIGHKNVTQLSLWESGDRLPPQVELVKLARLYAVPLDYLCGLLDDPLADPLETNQGLIVRAVADAIQAQWDSFTQITGQYAAAAIMGQRQDRADLQSVNEASAALKQALRRVKELNPGFEEDIRGSNNLEMALDRLEAIVARFEKRVESERRAKRCIESEVSLQALADAESRVAQFLLPLHEATAASA